MLWYRVAQVALCTSLGSQLAAAQTGQHWREPFKADHCVSRGMRQFSSQLMDIPWGTDWKAACNNMPATVYGYYFPKPTNCQENSGMWGLFNVPDQSCPHFATPPLNHGCSTEPGTQYRIYSSILWDIPAGVTDWESFCRDTPAINILPGTSGPFYPNKCEMGGGRMWGNWNLPDGNCPRIKPPPPPDDNVATLLGTKNCANPPSPGMCRYDVCSGFLNESVWPVWDFHGYAPDSNILYLPGGYPGLEKTVRELKQLGAKWLDKCTNPSIPQP